MSCYRDLNPGPLPYQGSALPLSYNSKKKKSGRRGSNPRPSAWKANALSTELLPHSSQSYHFVFLWAKMDSNHRSRKTADLQSAPFGHSGICPYNSLNKRTKIKQYNKLQRSIFVLHFLSLLSDSNQRPRDYKSRALAN